VAVRIDQNGGDMPWVVRMLAKVVILLFDLTRIYGFEYVCIDEAIMIFREQVKYITWEQEVLITLYWIAFEFG
jgi:hypothetical protein